MNRVLSFILIIIIMINLTGCWDSQPVEETFIVTGFGIDISEENPDKITVSAFGASFIKDAKKPYVVFSADGDNIGEALERIRNKSYRNISISHTLILLFSEEIARYGIRKYLDLFIRDAEIGSQLMVAITNVRAQEMFTAEVPSNPNVAFFISKLLETESKKVDLNECSLRGVVNQLNERYANLVLPYIELGQQKNEITTNRVCIFRKDNLVAVMKQDDTLPLLYLRGCLKRGTLDIGKVNVRGDGRKVISLRLYPKPRKVKARIEDENVHMIIYLKGIANIYELEPPEAKTDEKLLNEVKNAAEAKLEKLMINVIRKLQKEYKVDAIGLSEYLRVQYPDYYEKIDWEKIFPKIKIDLQIEQEVRIIGLTK